MKLIKLRCPKSLGKSTSFNDAYPESYSQEDEVEEATLTLEGLMTKGLHRSGLTTLLGSIFLM
ncbi:hypothetical protein CR513_12508, partial [Mucuna pruriens]